MYVPKSNVVEDWVIANSSFDGSHTFIWRSINRIQSWLLIVWTRWREKERNICELNSVERVAIYYHTRFPTKVFHKPKCHISSSENTHEIHIISNVLWSVTPDIQNIQRKPNHYYLRKSGSEKNRYFFVI